MAVYNTQGQNKSCRPSHDMVHYYPDLISLSLHSCSYQNAADFLAPQVLAFAVPSPGQESSLCGPSGLLTLAPLSHCLKVTFLVSPSLNSLENQRTTPHSAPPTHLNICALSKLITCLIFLHSLYRHLMHYIFYMFIVSLALQEHKLPYDRSVFVNFTAISSEPTTVPNMQLKNI